MKFQNKLPRTKSKVTTATRKLQTLSGSRVARLTPIVQDEIQKTFSNADYFTRDHVFYFKSLRQFSNSYRLGLVRSIINDLTNNGYLVRFNITDFAINTPENVRRREQLLKSEQVSYSGSYTTRAADELLNNEIPGKRFDSAWLAEWLSCLRHLSPQTRHKYAGRIIEDLVRRGVLKPHPNSYYTVNYI